MVLERGHHGMEECKQDLLLARHSHKAAPILKKSIYRECAQQTQTELQTGGDSAWIESQGFLDHAHR